MFAAHGVAVAYLFRSRAEGTARPDSDHDVAVLFAAAEPALDATVRLAADLAGVLGTEADVVALDRAELELRGRGGRTRPAAALSRTGPVASDSRSTPGCGGSSSAQSSPRPPEPTCGGWRRKGCADGRRGVRARPGPGPAGATYFGGSDRA